MVAYILNHLCDIINESQNHNKKNVSYARLLSELLHQSRLINAMKKDVVNPEASLNIRSGKTAYIENFPFISKLDNLEVIQQFIKIIREDTEITLTLDVILDAPENAYKPSRKRKQAASETQKKVQKPQKKKVFGSIQKEIMEIVSYIVLMPTKTRSGATGKRLLIRQFLLLSNQHLQRE